MQIPQTVSRSNYLPVRVVQYVVDDESNPADHVVDSKDTKVIVSGDVAPVQKPGKTLPVHDWEQERQNAVTHMTHLFLRPCPNILERENYGVKSSKFCF